MEDFNKIGLNIWGIRGGYRSFCHSENFDVEIPEIKNTWKDIREFVYVTDLTVRFYALEFTPNYKVFTLYRPENDTSRTGAYVATTIYVPHTLKINRILDLMRQISDAYHKDHYDAFGNPNTNPDYVQSYWQLIKNYASNIVRESDVRSWEGSTQNNLPKILPYTNPSVVEEFFDKPYRKEFLQHQEVMFWDIDYIQHQQSHGVKFQKMETLTSNSLFDTDGKNIAPQFQGGCIKNRLEDVTIERFEREGLDITQNWQSCFFYDMTNIAIVLKKPFFQPFSYFSTMIGMGSPFDKRGDDYEFSSARIGFKPRQYEIPVKVVNVGNIPFNLYFGNECVNIHEGRGTFRFDGKQANGSCKVTLRPGGTNEIKVDSFALNKFFITGSDELDRLQPCIIETLKVLHFQFHQECRGMLNMRWASASIDFNTVNKAFEIVLPAETKLSDFTIDVDGYKAEIKVADEENTRFEVTLTKQNCKIDIVVPEFLQQYMYPNMVVLKAGGKRYEGYNITIPIADLDNQLKLNIDVRERGGGLIVCDFSEKRFNNYDLVLYPKLALLQNSTNEDLRLNVPNTAFELPHNETMILPANCEPNIAKGSEKYNINVQTNSEGIKETTITLKVATSTASIPPASNTATTGGNTGGYQGGGGYGGYSGYQGGYQGGNANANKPYMGIYWYNDTECKLYDDVGTKRLGDDAYETKIDGRPCILCFDRDRRVVPEKLKKHEKANEKNGFNVMVNNGRCIVKSSFSKPKVQDRNINNGVDNGGNNNNEGGHKKRWILFGGLAFLLLLGGFVWLGIHQEWLVSKERTLIIETPDNYYFGYPQFLPKSSGSVINNKENSNLTLSLKRECEKVIVEITTFNANGNRISMITDTLMIDNKWFTKENNYMHTYSYESKITEYESKITERRPRQRSEEKTLDGYDANDNYTEDTICARFEHYLQKVWSLDCSLKMLDSLETWNNRINDKVVNGKLKKENSNYMKKSKIVTEVTKSDHTQDDGGDWVNNLIKCQRKFFDQLERCTDVSTFSKSKGRSNSDWGYNKYKNYYEDKQKEVIDKLGYPKDFVAAQNHLKENVSETTYQSISEAINK